MSSLLLYILIALGVASLGLAMLPLRPVTRPRAWAGLLAAAAGVTAVLMWPSPDARPARGAHLLDAALPRYQFSERHQTRICAPVERIAEAIRNVPGEEIRGLELLSAIRGLARVEGGGEERRPILESALSSGFVLLADTPRELVLGRTGEFWRLRPESHAQTVQEFEVSQMPKAVFNFVIDPAPFSCQFVTTETRIYTADPSALRSFAAYWRVIQPGSALLRRTWLDAIRTRAEAAR